MPEQVEPIGIRSTYLLNGRRVTISDLLEAELISPGAALRFKRPRKKETHHAVVRADGEIRLEDGQDFASPSRAAAIAADMRAVDGWQPWVVASSGRSLDSLREELLDQVAQRSAGDKLDGEASVSDVQHRYELLKDARGRSDSTEPIEMPVRELLSLWGAKERGARINQQIEADLANHGLVTSPSFRKVTMDSTVHLVSASKEVEVSGTAPSDNDEAVGLEVGLTVGNLPSALGGIASVPPQPRRSMTLSR